MAQLGHKRIGHIHGPKTFRSAHERLSGFKRGLEGYGLELAPELTVEGAYTFDSGVTSATRLLNRHDRPTAIFAGNDEMAVGVYVAARKAGLRIPEDLSIVGFDDTPISARIWPPLTTVRSPIREVVKRGAGSSGNQELQSFQLELVVRESTRTI